ncbi:pyridoxamine 5'-phosphate oxidase family protein [Oceanispirochaeta crateris]|uniref:Pyridoxamine 5'-phosphate oxidase family protein n=1 Tax=Oceanispirochaeta crateris TaxID=2518645 RepID=A0A5C1QNY9_9SPIO|nr:pyridoxamine 5'-phosphate oxidase family protein [Oceanispirochaeta crateris]QEN08700.1 pyridoxamine 5'-phosphate oxidase family protein [Oceanispirochaeta crateris]
MRRKEKEITDRVEIDSILKTARICRLAMIDGDTPYVIPLNYGYSQNTLYFHSANEGRKINILHKNPRACFEVEWDTSLVEGKDPCQWSMNFQSIIGSGQVEFIESPEQKVKALSIIMSQYSEKEDFSYPTEAVNGVTVFKLAIDEICGKQSIS